MSDDPASKDGLIWEMQQQIERLTRERDEARRRLCEELMESEGNPMFWKGAPGAAGVAERLGWDCFKETP